MEAINPYFQIITGLSIRHNAHTHEPAISPNGVYTYVDHMSGGVGDPGVANEIFIYLKNQYQFLYNFVNNNTTWDHHQRRKKKKNHLFYFVNTVLSDTLPEKEPEMPPPKETSVLRAVATRCHGSGGGSVDAKPRQRVLVIKNKDLNGPRFQLIFSRYPG